MTSFFVFAAVLVGFRVDIRMIEHLFNSKIVHKSTTTLLKRSFFCIYFALILFFVKKPTLLWSVVLFLKIFLLLFEKILKKYRENKFHTHLLLFVDRVILNVQAGKSFRHALERAHAVSDVFTQQRMRKLIESVCFAQQIREETLQSDFLISELRQIDQNPHKTLQRLEQLRRQLKIESEFRQKSAQVSFRFRTQSYIMCALYFALFVFVLRVCDLSRTWPMLLASIVFFLTGVLWVFVSGRRIKWKV
ncbi:MAG: hypothetical protein AB7F59_14305 [Bdellovibrionales bacterium]